ncbi:MAG: ROK family protein [Chromatiales bacterium]|jgi:fructokinase
MRIGVDLGGTKIEAAALDRNGEIVLRQRHATPQGDYAATLDVIRKLVSQLEAELQCRASVGIGIPGSVSPQSGLIRNANSTS